MLKLLLGITLLFPLAACGGGEGGDDAGDGDNGAAEASETAAGEQAGAEEAAEKICCGGGCDAPAGMCCNEDGTCGGNHEKLPVWEP